MKKHLVFMAVVAVLVLLVSAALADVTMYVYTKNGKSVHVRTSMSTKDNSNIAGDLPYGAEVKVYDPNYNGWAMVEYPGGGYGDYYIMSRFLSYYKPPKFDPSKGGETPSAETDTKAFTTVNQLNTLVKSVKFVDPYTVTVRPTRASGWTYLRWYPSRNSEPLATFSGDYQLTVIAELKDWYQVKDPQSGRTGFIYKSYIVK